MSDFALGVPSMVSGVHRFAMKQGICGNCALWGEHDGCLERSPGLPFYTMYMTIQARLRPKKSYNGELKTCCTLKAGTRTNAVPT